MLLTEVMFIQSASLEDTLFESTIAISFPSKFLQNTMFKNQTQTRKIQKIVSQKTVKINFKTS